jgi:16S rRNA processing protein RimM
MTSTSSFSPETHVLIGEVIKAQGLRGELKIRCYSGQPENLREYNRLLLADKAGIHTPELALLRSRPQGACAVVQLETIIDRNSAERFVGCSVFVAKSELPPPRDDEFYWLDFQGKKAATTDGRELGVITQLFSNGAQDIMVIVDGRNEYLVPVVGGIVKSITRETVVLEPPPGLLEMNISPDD